LVKFLEKEEEKKAFIKVRKYSNGHVQEIGYGNSRNC